MKIITFATSIAFLAFCVFVASGAYESPLDSKLIELLRSKQTPVLDDSLLEEELEPEGKTPLMEDEKPMEMLPGKKELHHIQPLQIQTLVRTEVFTSQVTYVDFPTCTMAFPAEKAVPTCNYRLKGRTQRSLISSPRSPHVPRPSKVTSVKSKADDSVVPPFPDESYDDVVPIFSAPVVVPQAKVIIVEATSTLTSYVTMIEMNTEMTVGIFYSGCIPSDAPKTTPCP